MPKTKAGLADLYTQGVDRALEERLPPERLAALKIRERIRLLVWTRLEIMGPAREAVRTALATFAMPQNVPLAARAGWRSADHMWRLAGDTATDFNHYTKRATLGAVYGSTLLAWLQDETEFEFAKADVRDVRRNELGVPRASNGAVSSRAVNARTRRSMVSAEKTMRPAARATCSASRTRFARVPATIASTNSGVSGSRTPIICSMNRRLTLKPGSSASIRYQFSRL